MPKYPVLEPLSHNQKDYAPGAVVEMTEDQAAALQPVSVIGEVLSDSKNQGLVAEKITLIKQAGSPGELQGFAEGETRKTVLDAIEARKAELTNTGE